MRIRLRGTTITGLCIIVLSVLVASPAQAAPAPAPVVSFYTNSTAIGGVPTFGGIAGFDRIGSSRYVLIPRDALPARFFTASVGYTSTIGSFVGAPHVDGGGPVLGAFNLPVLPGAAQFEGIRRAGGGYAVISGGAHPFVRITGPFGTYIRDLPLPTAWRPKRTTGLVPQRSLTGVAVAPSGQISVLTAGGLRQDAPNAARLLTFGKANPEFVYRTDRDKKAADILAINGTDFLVLERGAGRNTRLYWTTTRGATPVPGRVRLSGREVSMPKRAIFSSASVPRLNTGNMTGLAWGNWLPDLPWQNYRARTLFVVTDAAGYARVHSFEVHLPRTT